MDTLTGYRTIIVNLIALFAVWANTHYKIVIDPNAQMAIATTILTVANIALRLLTKTPVFKKEAADVGSNPVPESKTN